MPLQTSTRRAASSVTSGARRVVGFVAAAAVGAAATLRPRVFAISVGC